VAGLIALSSVPETIVTAMFIYLTSLISAGLLLAAIVATLILTGGWEAAAAGLAVVAATVWLSCFVVMLAAEDGAPGGRGPHAV
jgi:hypothetical protein